VLSCVNFLGHGKERQQLNKKSPPNGRAFKLALCFNLSAFASGSHLPADDIQCAAGFEPFNLLCIVGMVNRERILGAIAMV
jgi:hypothetical protein